LALFFGGGFALDLKAGPEKKEPQKKASAEKKDKKKDAKKKDDGKDKKPAKKKEKAFEDIIKDAKTLNGLFNLYKKDDSLYMEIQPAQFGKKFLYVPTLWTSVGYGGSGSYLDDKVFTWEKLEKKILLKWVNTRYTAGKTAEYRRAMNNVVPETIVYAFKIESTPHTKRKSYLVNLDGCFLADMVKLGNMFSGNPKYRFSVDRKRTFWGKVQAFPKNVELAVRYTLSSSKSRYNASVPDSSAFTVSVRYSISQLPGNNGFKPRLADDRVGYFMTNRIDFDKTGLDGSVVRYLKRWRLEKKNPGAAVSKVKKPVVFWLENTIPKNLRKPIRDGILEWNKAFEKAGLKNAIVVKQMPDDAKWDPADIRYNTIRWVTSLTGSGGGAFGPSRMNPLTGEILDADVVIFAPFHTNLLYNSFYAPLDSGLSANEPLLPGSQNPWLKDSVNMTMQRDLGVIHMLANGSIDNIADVPESFIYEFYKMLACHEVGHTLGLRHNFKGSTTVDLKDLHDKNYTRKNSMGNSIMEYLPANLAPKGVKQGEYWQTTIGAWDYWVIEYGYKQFKGKTPAQERLELQKIAQRSNQPGLIYGTDEDTYDFSSYAISVDPTCVVWDLGNDPLGFSEQEVKRVRHLWKQLEKRSLFKGESFVYLRNSFFRTLHQYNSSVSRLVKWIGGLYHKRSHVGDPNGSLPFQVVEYEKQRRAFDIIKKNLLAPGNFTFAPSFLSKMQSNRFFDWREFSNLMPLYNSGRFTHDFSMTSYLKRMYGGIVGMLYDPLRLQRIVDNEGRVKGKTLTLGDYLGELHVSTWQEIIEKKSISKERRILQRASLKHLTGLLLKPKAPVPGDALSVTRYLLKKLDKDIDGYLQAKAGLDLMTRAHLENSLDSIRKALDAGFAKKAM
jgi:hypothetical protein